MEWMLGLQRRLETDFGLTPVAATEIEFFLVGSARLGDDAALVTRLALLLAREGIPAHLPEKERSPEQFEIALHPTGDLARLARDTQRLKEAVAHDMADVGIAACFEAKPFPDRAGSGLHLHLHLEDGNGKNRFSRLEDENYSPELSHALGGLLAALPASMPFFAPNAADYARFVPENRAPTHLCWGPNNRTAALRLPPKPLDDKHVEHRVPGANARAEMALGAMLMGVHWGLAQSLDAPEAVHGEAHRPTYGLTRLPQNLTEAHMIWRDSTFAKNYPFP